MTAAQARVLTGPLLSVPVELLEPHPDNPRTTLGDLTEMAHSMRVVGVLNPLLVEPQPAGRYLILAGHRRLAAAKIARLATVPCLTRREGVLSEQMPVMLVENLQRAELTPLEQAAACGQLAELGLSREETGRRVGKSVTWVADRLALLELPADAQRLVQTRQITIAGAVQLGRQVRRAGVGHWQARPRCRGHLNSTHPLAAAARGLCDDQEHPLLGRVGRVACGACWEEAIRDDTAEPQDRRGPERSERAGGGVMPARTALVYAAARGWHIGAAPDWSRLAGVPE